MKNMPQTMGNKIHKMMQKMVKYHTENHNSPMNIITSCKQNLSDLFNGDVEMVYADYVHFVDNEPHEKNYKLVMNVANLNGVDYVAQEIIVGFKFLDNDKYRLDYFYIMNTKMNHLQRIF